LILPNGFGSNSARSCSVPQTCANQRQRRVPLRSGDHAATRDHEGQQARSSVRAFKESVEKQGKSEPTAEEIARAP
jgi:hypothetical protein